MLHHRLAVLLEVLDRPWFKWASGLLSLAGLYDLAGAQFVSSNEASKMPRLHDLVAASAGWIPWWGWGWLLTGLLVLAMLEYATQQRMQLKADAKSKLAPRDIYPAEKIEELRSVMKEMEQLAMAGYFIQNEKASSVIERFRFVARDFQNDDNIEPKLVQIQSNVIRITTIRRMANAPASDSVDVDHGLLTKLIQETMDVVTDLLKLTGFTNKASA